MQVTLIGLGGGTLDTLTQQARDALQTAPLILGAKRLLEALPENGAKKIPAVRSQDILSILQESREETACVVFSGDTGFYSGAKGLLPLLEQAGIPGAGLAGPLQRPALRCRLGRPGRIGGCAPPMGWSWTRWRRCCTAVLPFSSRAAFSRRRVSAGDS